MAEGDNAAALCASKDMTLGSIESTFEQEYLKKKAISNNCNEVVTAANEYAFDGKYLLTADEAPDNNKC